MKRVLVRYKVKADRAAENQEYIERVFEEHHKNAPEGLRYASFKAADGVSFVHLASIETQDGSNPLSETAAFRAFQEEIKDRCEEPPAAIELHEVVSYRLLDS